MKKTFKLTLALSTLGSLTTIPFIAAACGPNKKNDPKPEMPTPAPEKPKTNSNPDTVNKLNEEKTNAKTQIQSLNNLNEEEKNSFNAKIDLATDENSINSIKSQANTLNELNSNKKAANSAIDEFSNLSEEQKTNLKTEVNNAKTKEVINQKLEEAKTKDQSNLTNAKNSDTVKIDALIWLTKKQKTEAKNDINSKTSVNGITARYQEAVKLNTDQTKKILDLNTLIPSLKFMRVTKKRYKPNYVPQQFHTDNKYTYVQFAIKDWETEQKVSWLLQYIKRYGTNENLKQLENVFRAFVTLLYKSNNDPELYFTSHFLLFVNGKDGEFRPALKFGAQNNYEDITRNDLWTPKPILGGISKQYATTANSGTDIEPKDLMVRENHIGSTIGLVNSLLFIIKARDWDSIKGSPYGMPPDSPEYQITGLRKNYQTPYGPANATTTQTQTETVQQ
ncbi:hypothetical protein EG856_01760 [Mycoplasmopsis phocirhinis]|uniref:Extracellular matrix-binding protein ebh GA module domain-containing protein n=1 Tax=Mycoplasmopsis phocirhinis TaxID=142650 RepID=A0A4P6MNQ2_9BACT|nr:variable surface lipoprotein [Mycoplasmopsis phocirhinis]QBF34643.1 hypothetical protein EG856_01760 [Mycoplasmopsis phocirhinis]